MVVPTSTDAPFNTDKGKTLSTFINYFLCAGQKKADILGYSPLPKNLVLAGFDQVRRIPGAVQVAVDQRLRQPGAQHPPVGADAGQVRQGRSRPAPPVAPAARAAPAAATTGGSGTGTGTGTGTTGGAGTGGGRRARAGREGSAGHGRSAHRGGERRDRPSPRRGRRAGDADDPDRRPERPGEGGGVGCCAHARRHRAGPAVPLAPFPDPAENGVTAPDPGRTARARRGPTPGAIAALALALLLVTGLVFLASRSILDQPPIQRSATLGFDSGPAPAELQPVVSPGGRSGAPEVDPAWLATVAGRTGIPVPALRAYARVQLVDDEPAATSAGPPWPASAGWSRSTARSAAGRSTTRDTPRVRSWGRP